MEHIKLGVKVHCINLVHSDALYNYVNSQCYSIEHTSNLCMLHVTMARDGPRGSM